MLALLVLILAGVLQVAVAALLLTAVPVVARYRTAGILVFLAFGLLIFGLATAGVGIVNYITG